MPVEMCGMSFGLKDLLLLLRCERGDGSDDAAQDIMLAAPSEPEKWHLPVISPPLAGTEHHYKVIPLMGTSRALYFLTPPKYILTSALGFRRCWERIRA